MSGRPAAFAGVCLFRQGCVMPIRMLPVFVWISHTPPDVVFGTSTLPVLVPVMNTLSESRVPVTSPVVVLTYSSAASACPAADNEKSADETQRTRREPGQEGAHEVSPAQAAPQKSAQRRGTRRRRSSSCPRGLPRAP